MHDPTLRKLLSAVAHGSIFFSATLVSIGVPIVIMLVTEDPVVKANAVESLNFHLNIFAWFVVFGLLSLLLIGLPLLFGAWVLSLILPLMAIVSVLSDSDTPHSYPMILRLL
jgi:uncharacterized Tic20 family protein